MTNQARLLGHRRVMGPVRRTDDERVYCETWQPSLEAELLALLVLARRNSALPLLFQVAQSLRARYLQVARKLPETNQLA